MAGDVHMSHSAHKTLEPYTTDRSDSSSDSESEVGELCDGALLSLVDDEVTHLVVPDLTETACEVGYDEYEGEESGHEGGEAAGDTTDTAALSTHRTVEDDTCIREVKKKKKRRKRYWTICLANCKYDVVKRMARKYGFREVIEEEDWSLYWTDFSVNLDRVMEMKRYQKINHFPGMSEICRKDLLARNLNRLVKLFPKEYNVFPKTWCLPADYGDFSNYTRLKKNKTYILKPESSCQGRGIWVTKNPRDIKPTDHMICQQYISKPFLIDGFKFDLRVYTLVTSCDPLRIFVFKEGLARFATAKYQEPNNNNTDNMFMHLTNYAINKHSDHFIRDEEKGSKRRITTMNRWLERNNYDVQKLWRDIDDVIVKTIISSHSILKHNYRTCFPNHIKTSACFEILGYDIMFDKKLKPFVLEVNHSPSFTTDSDLDREIKSTLIYDSLNLVNFAAVDRRKCIEEERKRIKERLFQKGGKKESKEDTETANKLYLAQLEKYESTHMGNFRRIYPTDSSEKYDRFFHTSGSLFQETAAFKARVEMARQQREEIARKQEKADEMKGKKPSIVMRPESPVSGRKKVRRPSVHHRLHNQRGMSEEKHSPKNVASCPEEYVVAVDTSVAIEISEVDELERIAGLLQRENLIRGLGVVDHVYKLLEHVSNSMSPGNAGVSTKELYRDNFKHQGNINTNSGLYSPRRQTYRYKDRSYYQRLLNKYYGTNAVLLTSNRPNTIEVLPETEQDFAMKRYPFIKYSRADVNELEPSIDRFYEQNDAGYLQPSPLQTDNKPELYKVKNVFAKCALSHTNRQRMTRRNLARTISTNIVPESEFRFHNDPEVMRGAAGRLTTLERTCESASIRHQWSVATRQPVLGLSVISAPAPVNQRPGRLSPSPGHVIRHRSDGNTNQNNVRHVTSHRPRPETRSLKPTRLEILDKQYVLMS